MLLQQELVSIKKRGRCLTAFSHIWHGYFTGPGLDSISPASDNISSIQRRPTAVSVVLTLNIFFREIFNIPVLIQLAHSFALLPASCLVSTNLSLTIDGRFSPVDIKVPVSVINLYMDDSDSSSMLVIIVNSYTPGASTPVTGGRCNHTYQLQCVTTLMLAV